VLRDQSRLWFFVASGGRRDGARRRLKMTVKFGECEDGFFNQS
jgi:hypothetical protein